MPYAQPISSGPLKPEPFSPSNRRLVFTPVRPTGAKVSVLEVTFASRGLPWPTDRAIYGISQHPSEERALLSADALFEVDLDAAEMTEIHPKTGWICGYLDADHVVTIDAGTLSLFQHRKGELLGTPLTTLACGGDNLYVGVNRCFVTNKGKSVSVVVRDGNALRLTATYELRSANPTAEQPPVPPPITRVQTAVVEEGKVFIGRENDSGSGSYMWYRLFDE